MTTLFTVAAVNNSVTKRKETAMGTYPEMSRRNWLKIAAASATGVMLGGYSVLVKNVAAATADIAPGSLNVRVAKVKFDQRQLAASSQAEIADSLAPLFLQLVKQAGAQGSDEMLLGKIKGLTRAKGGLVGSGAEAGIDLTVSGITKFLGAAPGMQQLQQPTRGLAK